MSELIKNPAKGFMFIDKNMDYFKQNFSNAQLFFLLESSYFCRDFSLFNSDKYLEQIKQTDNSLKGLVVNATFKDCVCYYSWYCQSTNGGTCNNGGCNSNHNTLGCGVFGTTACTGMCW